MCVAATYSDIIKSRYSCFLWYSLFSAMYSQAWSKDYIRNVVLQFPPGDSLLIVNNARSEFMFSFLPLKYNYFALFPFSIFKNIALHLIYLLQSSSLATLMWGKRYPAFLTHCVTGVNLKPWMCILKSVFALFSQLLHVHQGLNEALGYIWKPL